MNKVPEKIQKRLQELLVSSPCNKRKVAAIIVDKVGTILSEGRNHCKEGRPCEDEEGNTTDTVVHAEIDAILSAREASLSGTTIYVTHQPCKGCQAEIDKYGYEVVISEQFMKFDTGKLRYSLIPPEATKALASVLTYGAKKYKPNNWREVNDTARYVDALYRHLEAWRAGEQFDEESKLPHLEHALTNIAFLIALDVKN